MKSIFFKYIWLIILLSSLTDCENKEFEFPADYYTKLHGKIRNLEHLRSQLQKSFDFYIKTLQEKLTGDIPNFGAISWNWKAKSSQFKNELEKMRIDATNLKKLSSTYFEKLIALETKIRDYELRKIENEANLKHKNDWLVLEKAIFEEIEALEGILDKSEDIFKIIVNAGNRQNPANPLKVFGEMQTQVERHLNRLGTLLINIKQQVSIPKKNP